MRVIFLKDIPRIGKKYDIKDVSDGYAVNFLLPRKLAQNATAGALAELETRKKQIILEREVQENILASSLEKIKGKTVTIKGRANEKGNLFSAIHKKEIIDEMKNQHHAEIADEFIVLPKPIKEIGEFEISIEIPASLSGKFKKSSLKVIVEKI